MFIPIRAETSLTIDHQTNVGKKREKRKYGTAQEKAAGSHLREIHLEQNMMRAKNGRREERHYLRERAAPGGEPTSPNFVLSEFHRFSEISSTIHIPKI